MVISLNGFMGCGKSSIGRLLSERMGWELVDLDQLIEERTGRKIPEIFAADGETGFRAAEKDALEMVLGLAAGTESDGDSFRDARIPELADMVLSLGGGTVTTPECAAMVRERSFCIYLRASVDTLVKNLHADFESRPMLSRHGGQPSGTEALRSRIEELMAIRKDIYESCAHLIIDIDSLSFEETAAIIAEKIPK